MEDSTAKKIALNGQKIALTGIIDQLILPLARTHGQAAVLPSLSDRSYNDRVSGADADRHDDISHNGSSGFGGNADSADTVI